MPTITDYSICSRPYYNNDDEKETLELVSRFIQFNCLQTRVEERCVKHVNNLMRKNHMDEKRWLALYSSD